jgi:hypothetical protein
MSNDADYDVTFRLSPGYHENVALSDGGRDFTGDGVADILFTDDHSPNRTPSPSRAIALFGGDLEAKAGLLSEVTESFELVNYEPSWGGECRWLGYPVRFDFAGDANGDGYEDLVAYDGGHAYIYFNPLGMLDEAFVRGDANQDGQINIADPIVVLNYLFARGKALPCFDAADANDDESINIADAIMALGYLFGGTGALPPPTICGPDPAGDALGCADSACR